VELHQEARDSRELVANLKGELSFQRIQVFTPKGDLRSLPENATPIDFAYSIHTEVGHHCVGAKVNGRMVPLRHVLKNGDRVEVFTRADHKPSRDWLNVVVSAGAKTKIQLFIREEERAQAIVSGKERLEREARNLGVRLESHEVHAAMEARLKELKFTSWDSFYASVGFNRTSPRRLLDPVIPETHKVREEKIPAVGHDTVLVDDNVGILYVLASCCKPIWGDEIVGYTTRGRGISIHRANCPHLSASAPNPERLVSVGWGKAGKATFNAELVVTSEDRPGMVGLISTAVQNAGFSMQRFSASTTEEGGGIFYMALRVKDRTQLVDLMGAIRKLKGVFTVERVRGSYFGNVH
jgi:GTP diphosphokinase / guanosine-3',5'-bis(diphosphate) 3'-diphosphatase